MRKSSLRSVRDIVIGDIGCSRHHGGLLATFASSLHATKADAKGHYGYHHNGWNDDVIEVHFEVVTPRNAARLRMIWILN